MGVKGISELSDDEMAGMTDEQLEEAMAADAAAADADGEEDGAGEGDGAGKTADGEADGEADGAGDGDGGSEAEGEEAEGAGANDGEEGEDGALTKEQLEALARDDDGRSDMVPRARLNEVLQSERDLREILRTVAAGQQAAAPAKPVEEEAPKRPEFDFKAANREYHKLLTDGEEEKALAKLDEIEDARTALHQFDIAEAERKAEERTYSRVSADQTSREVNTVAAEMVKRYPFLDNKSEKANEAAILAVNAKAKQLVAAGKSPAEALHEAAIKIGGQFAKVLEIPGKNDKKPDGKKPVKAGEDPRSKDALQRNIGIRQPPGQKSGVGTREQLRTLDISNMTDEQIEKLSPEELAEARGDTRIG